MSKLSTAEQATHYVASEVFCKKLKRLFQQGLENDERSILVKIEDPAGPYLRIEDETSQIVFRIYLKKSENVAIKAHGLTYPTLDMWKNAGTPGMPFAHNSMADMTLSFRLKEWFGMDMVFKRLDDFIIQCTEDPSLSMYEPEQVLTAWVIYAQNNKSSGVAA